MLQDFLNWIKIKFQAHTKQSRPSFEEREVWWCHLGQNVGDEQNGKGQNFTRPVIIIKKSNANFCLAIPLSTQIKNSPFYFPIHFLGKDQSILISQIRVLDAKRFRTKMGKIDKSTFLKIQNHCKNILF